MTVPEASLRDIGPAKRFPRVVLEGDQIWLKWQADGVEHMCELSIEGARNIGRDAENAAWALSVRSKSKAPNLCRGKGPQL